MMRAYVTAAVVAAYLTYLLGFNEIVSILGWAALAFTLNNLTKEKNNA